MNGCPRRERNEQVEHRRFRTAKLFFIFIMVNTYITYLSKPIEYTAPRVNSNVSYGPWVIRGFINIKIHPCNRCTTGGIWLLPEGCECVGTGGIWELTVLSVLFTVNLIPPKIAHLKQTMIRKNN